MISQTKKLKIILKISILTIFFSLVIFLLKSFYFEKDEIINQNIEEKYIEPIALDSPKESLYQKILKNTEESKKEEIVEIKKIIEVDYSYLPSSFEKDIDLQIYKEDLNTFFSSKTINEKLTFLKVYLYKDKGEVRGRMKDAKLHLFGILSMPKGEFVAVSIHEFGHFLDLYILSEKNGFDISDIFYNLSWASTSVINNGQSQEDFVSGYSMTNKYEDFAETFAYYIIHNKAFLEKSGESQILKEKYNFFKNYIFRNGAFVDYDDKDKEEIKDYYRDITKIDYDLESFLTHIKYFGEPGNEKFLEKTFGI